MKIVGICSSPRVGGNTEVLLDEALEGAKELGAEVQLIRVAGKNLQPCDGCGTCHKTGECHIQDDDMNEIFQKMIDADGIIIGSPVYWWLPTAQTQTIMDRSLSVWWGKVRETPAMGELAYGGSKLRYKVGGALATSWERGGTVTIQAINGWFLQHGMFIGGAYDGVTTGPSKWAEPDLFWKKGWIKEDKKAMKMARALGRSVALLAEKTQSLRQKESQTELKSKKA